MNTFFLVGLLLLGTPPAAPVTPTGQNRSLLTNARSESGPLFPPDSARAKRREAAHAEVKAAQKLAKQGKTSEAVAKYKTLLADPQRDNLVYPELLEGLGDLYEQQGRTHEALELYRPLVYVKPGQMWLTSRSNDPDLRMKFALLLHQAGQYEEAMANYNKGMEGAAVYTRMMDARLPMEPDLFTLSTANGPTGRLPFAAHMAIAACRKDFDKAECLTHLREAVRLRPNHAQAHYYLGSLLLSDETDTKTGTENVSISSEAVAELEKTITLDTSLSGNTRRAATDLLTLFRNATRR